VSETVSLEAGLSLHSNWQILTRATLDRNVPTLLRAGADLVLSYAAMGSNTILNVLRGPDHLLLAEGVNVSLAQIPASMAGRRLQELHLRSQTGCSIIAVESGGEKGGNPPVDGTLPASGRIYLIGTIEAEDQFLKRFRPPLLASKKRRGFGQ
jgi:voltage-gated potassium channel